MRHHHSPGIRGQLMWFLCCICLFLLALVWFLSTQLLEPLYTKHIEKQLTTQAESITAELDKAIANGEALSAWSFGHLTVNTQAGPKKSVLSILLSNWTPIIAGNTPSAANAVFTLTFNIELPRILCMLPEVIRKIGGLKRL